jgi:hypothetical protein
MFLRLGELSTRGVGSFELFMASKSIGSHPASIISFLSRSILTAWIEPSVFDDYFIGEALLSLNDFLAFLESFFLSVLNGFLSEIFANFMNRGLWLDEHSDLPQLWSPVSLSTTSGEIPLKPDPAINLLLPKDLKD